MGPTILPSEESARRSRLGYHYQDLIAASFCIEMMTTESLLKVGCETQDDVVLTWVDSVSDEFAEFVQVKSDRLTQQWTLAKFVSPEGKNPLAGTRKNAPSRRKD